MGWLAEHPGVVDHVDLALLAVPFVIVVGTLIILKRDGLRAGKASTMCAIGFVLFVAELMSFVFSGRTQTAGGVKSVSELVSGVSVAPSTVNEVWNSRGATGAFKLVLRTFRVDGFGKVRSGVCDDPNLVSEAQTVGVAAGERNVGRRTTAITSAVVAGGRGLAVGDEVLSVNGTATQSATAYWQVAYSSTGPWKLVTKQHRDGLTVTSIPCVHAGQPKLVGATIRVVPQFDLGNSNALATALGTVHALEPFPHTRRPIVVTGALVDDRVSAVGGIRYKVRGANAANACMLIVPKPRTEEVRRLTEAFRGRVVEVSSVQEAVDAVRSSPDACN